METEDTQLKALNLAIKRHKGMYYKFLQKNNGSRSSTYRNDLNHHAEQWEYYKKQKEDYLKKQTSY